jgi:uncharacterized protein (TIGR02284 family)
MDKDTTVSTLNHLIAIAKDGYSGMSSAAESAKSASLKITLQQLSQERNRVATTLQAEVQRLSGDPDEGGTVLGVAHRAYMNLKQAIAGNSDKALVDECERGEDIAMSEFKEAIAKDLPQDVVQTLQSCFAQVQKSHEQIS